MSCGKAVVVIGGGGAGGVRVRIGGVGMIDGGMGGGIGVVATAGGGRRERLIGGGRLVNPGVTLIEGRKLEIGLRGGERRLRDLGERETVDGERRFRDREMVEGDRLALEPVRAVAPSSPHVTTVSSPVRGGVDRSCYSWRSVNSRDDPDLCPDCAAYYSNRSACYMMLGKYTEALSDAREAVRLDKSFVKGYLRVAKCNIALGDATAAQSVLRQATELDPANRAIREEAARAQSLLKCQEEVAKATGKADYRTAIYHLDRALELAVGCRALKITKAEYLVFLQRYPDAQEIINEILQFDSGNADAIYVRGMCLYYQDNPDAAFHHFQHVLRLAPDHHKARQVYKKAKLLKQKKEEGNEAFKRGSYQEAYSCYTEALAIDPLNRHTNAKLYFNRATVGSKINKVDEAVEDCTAAINLDEGYVKAYLRRAKCYQQLEKHDEAVRDYDKVTRLDRSQEHKRLLQDAKMQLKRSKRKDYYKILGVIKTATDDEIKKSYRKMALIHHPDRHANATEKDKQDHEVKFKEIGEAYSVLTDGKKRAMYDRGHDFNDPDGGFSHEEFDPNQIFQAFFSGGGHGGYPFGSHSGGFPQGGFPGGNFSGGSSFPGGFHFQFS